MTSVRQYRIEGLTCADCARRIETAAGGLPGVSSAVINLASGTIRLELRDEDSSQPDVERRLSHLVSEIEPDAALTTYARGAARGGAVHRRPNSTPNPQAYSKHIYAENEHASARGAEHGAKRLTRSGGEARRFRLRVAQVWTALLLFVAALLIGAFAPSPGVLQAVRPAIFVLSYALAGFDVIRRGVRSIVAGRGLDEHVLMTIATAGAWVLGEGAEAVAVMVFYQIGDTLQALAVGKARGAVRALLELRPILARRLDADGEQQVAPHELRVGDRVLVLPGERLAVDGTVVSTVSLWNAAALTGESVPVQRRAGDAVQAGLVAEQHATEVRVTALESESTIARLTSLVEDAAGRKAQSERLMTSIARVYTPVVVGAAALLALAPPLAGFGSLADWTYRALVFLVVACPCALVVSIPLAYFAGIGVASRLGALVKGANYLDALAKVDTVAFDKTGTLTTGTFSVTAVEPAPGVTGVELLSAAVLAERGSTHPIARAIVAFAGAGDQITENDLRFEEYAGRGTVVWNGTQRFLAGTIAHLSAHGITTGFNNLGDTIGVVHIARDARYLGRLLLSDPLRPESTTAVAQLRELGVRRMVLLSGDTAPIAHAVGQATGMDSSYGALLPADKLQHVEELLRSAMGNVMFVGDGINDAAVIARVDVGCAMGEVGSDAAVESADVVLMRDSLTAVPQLIRSARRTRAIVFQNIAAALGIKSLFLLAAALGFTTMWMAVFADVGVTVLTVLNTLRIGVGVRRDRQRN